MPKKKTKKVNKSVTTQVKTINCIQGLAKLVQPGSVDLLIADPPYNMGKSYESYVDTKPFQEYIIWSREWIGEAVTALNRYGSMWIFINDALVSEIDVMCKEFFGLKKRSHIIWHYTFGQNHQKNFTPSHTHLLYYTKHKSKYTFNKDDPSLRHPSARQVKYNDKRANPTGRLPDNTWVLFPEQLPEAFDPAGDTWLASRVCGTFNEREHHIPNQIPLPIMHRIVTACSNPGDLVVDPFCGSGSSGVVSKMLGRNYIGMDVSKTSVEESRKRIKSAKQQH